jgi:hypothetical protein
LILKKAKKNLILLGGKNMISLGEKIKEMSKLEKYQDELFYSPDNEFFIVYDGKIAKREDPGCRSYFGILKISTATALLIKDYCEEMQTTVSDLRDRVEDWFDDIRTPEAILDTEELDEETETFLKMCIQKGQNTDDIIRAIIMLTEGCDANVWYMLINDYIGVADSVAEFGEILDFRLKDEDRDAEWEPVINNLDCYIYNQGELL